MSNFIWTNHARDRLNERRMTEDLVVQTIEDPDKSFITQKGAKELTKRFGGQTVTVMLKKNDNNEDVIVSCWIDPPNPGTKDEKKHNRYKQFQKGGALKKLWLTLLDQLGL